MYLFSLIYGLLAALAAFVLQVFISSSFPFLILSPLETTASVAALVILFLAFTEESLKAIAVIKGLHVPPIPYRAFLHAFFVGVGFTIVEFSLISLQPYASTLFSSQAIIGNIIIHAFSPLLITAFFIMLQKSHWLLRNATALITVTLLHASYNILAFTGYAPATIPQLLLLGTIITTTIFAVIYILSTHHTRQAVVKI